MKAWPTFRTLALLVVLCLMASIGHAQSLKTLRAKQDSDGVVKLDMGLFMKYVVDEKKEYSVVLQLTALSPKYKCGPCKAIDRTLRAVARGWKKQANKGGRDIVFGSLDVEDAEELFQQMKIDNIPRLMIFPAAKGAQAFENPSPRELSLSARTSSPSGMASKLSELFGVKMQAEEQTDYMKYLSNLIVAAAAICAIYLVYRHIDLRMLGRNVWSIATILFVLLMTSGFMWNRINNPPYMGQTRSGDVILFAPVNNQQYGVETQIVAVTYAICSLCVVALVRHVPRIQNADQRSFVTFMFVAALVLTFSYLNSVFRMKMPAYPYKLLLP
ncbi:oligosaccharyl transferase subunit ost3/OST6 [Coemansia sp. RSA 1722]|nr:oligosaccharyl transferase subunit ost3/OST6 [Coemansia sp. RSA 486]KAJ2238338.1 oligosaccharyl transferase subunit ost3/OST6 [Coemansia sp. RSA 485]KAJ2606626.1 oligosaccharyl transferase subunit ost3/OST6 [Coemansia sp. RSA 1722]